MEHGSCNNYMSAMGMQFVCITPCHSHRQSRPRVETSLYIYVPGSPLLGLTRSTVLAFLSSSLIQYVPLLAQKIRDRPISASRSSITLTASDPPRRILLLFVRAPGGCDFVNEVVIDFGTARPCNRGQGRGRPWALEAGLPSWSDSAMRSAWRYPGGLAAWRPPLAAGVFAGRSLER